MKHYTHYTLFVLLLSASAVTGQDTLSFGGIYDLPGAEVRATYTPVSPLAQRFTVEEVYRLPGTFYDPARLVALMPGVIQTNDQANHLSVRGNSPNANLWRLNGLAIVNPNHTANAGTFYDFPTLNGGGVNAISAQMLDNSGFLAGGLPVEYGYAPGGTFDLRLRPGSKNRRRHQVQAGFIGLDLTTEGPIGSSGRTSYLINGRYSFTGLLADMGVDFGGEEIRFADVNAHVHHESEKSSISLFGIYGNSSNDFSAPDPAEEEITEQKELLNINYGNDVNVIGVNFTRQLGLGNLSGGVAYSSTFAERIQMEEEESPAGGDAAFTSDLSIINANLQYAYTSSEQFSYQVGAEFMEQQGTMLLTFTNLTLGGPPTVTSRSDVPLTIASPYAGFSWQPTPAFTLNGGLRANLFSQDIEDFTLSPRLKVTYQGRQQRWIFAADMISSASYLARLNNGFTAFRDEAGPVNTTQFSLTTARRLGKVNLQATAFFQRTFDERAAQSEDFLISANNLLEIDPGLTFTQLTDTRRFGVELEFGGGRKADGWYYRGSMTLLNAETQQADDSWSKDRYAVNYIGKLTLGREWTGQDKKDRERTYGLNLALISHGGERYGMIASPGRFSGSSRYFARQNISNGFLNANGTYFRPDLRLYKTKTRPKTTTTLALDIQNVAGIENIGNVYYDVFLDRPNERFQLGLIPVLTYRILWR